MQGSGASFILYSTPPAVVHPYATVSIKSHVPMTLAMKNSTYSKWASFFKSMCDKFGLKSHIDGTVAPPPDIFDSVDDSVLDLAINNDEQTARALCLAIEGLFHANKQFRTIFLSHDFHSMTEGDSSISEYCQRMKTLADALRDVDHPIQDSQLVLNLLRGLNPRYSNTADDIANSTASFPTFAQARDMLTLKELRLANEEKVSTTTVLLAGTSSSSSSYSCPGGCRSASGFVQTNGGGGKKWKGK
ncbi:uncharacterized protein LOC111258440 [Setaria italica]|uniref:uncharacterized protein LOC111258440 n=1 Tax=Setaria italica TaxID=4555 RepID=UPI000BE4D91B|nr:uncharacterized protein LOC111258440 [Setaria italica]